MEIRLRRGYWVRMGILCLIFGQLAWVLGWFGAVRRMPLLAAFAAVMFGGWLWIAVRDYLRGPRRVDVKGIVRRDGRRFEWADLREKTRHSGRLPGGAEGPLNHLDLRFAGGGLVRVFPFVLEDVAKVLALMEKPWMACAICGEIPEYSRGFQVGGREDEDTFLPAGAGSLEKVKEAEPGRNRGPVLQRCPGCGAYFLYETSYEFLVSGSEDEQVLTRLSDAEAARYLGL